MMKESGHLLDSSLFILLRLWSVKMFFYDVTHQNEKNVYAVMNVEIRN